MTVEAHHVHYYEFAPLSLPLSALSFELVYEQPHPREVRRRRADGGTLVSYRPGLINHVAFRPHKPDQLEFSLQAHCTGCGAQLTYGPFHLKELQGYLIAGEHPVREILPDEAE